MLILNHFQRKGRTDEQLSVSGIIRQAEGLCLHTSTLFMALGNIRTHAAAAPALAAEELALAACNSTHTVSTEFT